MSARHASHPLEQSKRILDIVTDASLGISALGNLMRSADTTQIGEADLAGLGLLLNVIGTTLIDAAHQSRELIDKHPG